MGFADLLKAVRRVFSNPARRLTRMYRRDRGAFFRKLRNADIFVFAAMDGEGIPTENLTEERMLAEIEYAAKESAAKHEFEPFLYESAGQLRLPFFTSNEQAQGFAGEYCRCRDRFQPLLLLGVKGSLLAELSTACDVLVMNDGSAEQVELAGNEVATFMQNQ